MKVSPIRSYSTNSGNNEEKTNFKGRMEIYYGGRPYLQAHKYFHPNSSIEENIGKYHSAKTGKVYFADPMEPVSESIKNDGIASKVEVTVRMVKTVNSFMQFYENQNIGHRCQI